jgi:cytochrome P450
VSDRPFDRFYRALRVYVASCSPSDRSLVALSVRMPHNAGTCLESQIPHWLFAIGETLATNTVRALALIASHPEHQWRARAELEQHDLLSPAGIHGLKYLEGCLQEAMRLWPTTPILLREVIEDDRLEGEQLPYGIQVMLPNTLNHRDSERNPKADKFCPETWLHGPPNGLFNHLSSGSQDCAGKELALFLGKAVLATMLTGGNYELANPRLAPDRPLPRSFNYFAVRFVCRDTRPKC